jgi:hypothetical protein
MLFVVFLQSAERGAQSVKATADCRLPTGNSQLATANCQPPTADFPLLFPRFQIHPAAFNKVFDFDSHQMINLFGHRINIFHALVEITGHFIVNDHIQMKVGEVADAVGNFENFGIL